jgi:chaperonin GroES
MTNKSFARFHRDPGDVFWRSQPPHKKTKEVKQMAMKIRPLGDRVLVEPKEVKEEMKGGIYIPDTAKEKPMEGTVIALGKKTDKDDKEIAFDVKVGDTVLLPKYGGTEVKIGDKTYQLVREEDLLGVIEK